MSFRFKSLSGTDQSINGHNHSDNKGNPTGGHACSGPIWHESTDPMPGLLIRFQDGPCDRSAGEKPNGTFVEDLLEVCRRRLKFYQESAFKCLENAEAISHIQAAINCLENRSRDRKERGVKGTLEK